MERRHCSAQATTGRKGPARRSNRATVLSLWIALGLTVAAAAWAQFGAAGVVRGFKLPEFYERAPGQTNRVLKTLITGSEAKPNGPAYDVRDMRIETFEETGQTNIIARAPQCNVDLARRIVWSTGRLEVATANGQFQTEGNEGFFCRMSNTVVIMSNRVRTVINRQLVQQRTQGTNL